MATLVRKHSLNAGAIDALAVTDVHEHALVTAVRTGSGDLKVIAWTNDGTTLQRTDDAVGGAVEDVSICNVGYDRVATACRRPSGELALALWKISSDGQLQQTDVATAGTMSKAAPVGLGAKMLATPLIDSEGNLKVIAWAVSDDGKLTRCGDASGGGVSSIATDNWSDGRFITAVRNANDDLELIHWVVLPNGAVDRLGEATGGTVSSLDIIRNHQTTSLHAQEFITAVRDASGRLKLIAWEARSDGSIHRLGDFSGTFCSKPSLTWVGAARHAVAYRNPEGELRVQCFYWGVTSDPNNPGVPTGDAFELREAASAGGVSLIEAAETGFSASLVTAVRNASGNLQVILWALEF